MSDLPPPFIGPDRPEPNFVMSLTRPSFPRRRPWWLVSLALSGIGAGCGSGDGQGVDVPALEIRTTTTGTELDPDGYQVSVDGGSPQAIGLVDSLVVDPLPAGPHTVTLSGLADNCGVPGGPTVTATVEAGKTAEVSYTVDCSPTHGRIVVFTTTTGDSLDPNGYQVQLDDTGQGPIGVNDSLSIQGVPPGDRVLTLRDVSANCDVDGNNPRHINMNPGEIDSVKFRVRCQRPVGTIAVQVTSSGTPADPDGYTVSLDQGPGQPVDVSDTLALSDVAVGSHSVTLAGLAPNCHVQSDNPVQVEVTLGASVTAAFVVSCLGDSQVIAFTANAPGLLAAFVVSPDGSGLTQLTPDTLLERDPMWSPDGRRLLVVRVDPSFASEALYVMNADGSDRTELVGSAPAIVDYRWSPDGGRIAFSLGRIVGGRLVSDLWVMRADGSGKLRLASNAEEPTWSPDGTKIAYVRDGGMPQLRILSSTGGFDHQLTPDSLGTIQPAWSPDGSLIAFTAIGPNQLYVITPDGAGLLNLTQGVAQEDGPVWSPDGTKIAFNSGPTDQPLESEVVVVNPDGSGRTTLTHHPGFDLSPDWSPDGRRIVFVRTDNGDNEIYVMNSDGSHPTDISRRPNSFESAPDWAGSASSALAGRQSGVETTVGRMVKALEDDRTIGR
jgi:Tol biopolymer transport system component